MTTLIRINRNDYLPVIKDSDYYRGHPGMSFNSTKAAPKVKKWEKWEYKIKVIGDEYCPKCKGKGKKGLFGSRCSACEGEGLVPIIECPNCKGTGSDSILFIKIKCSTCRGTKMGLFF